MQDLAHWADGAYRVPGDNVESADPSINLESDPDSFRRR